MTIERLMHERGGARGKLSTMPAANDACGQRCLWLMVHVAPPTSSDVRHSTLRGWALAYFQGSSSDSSNVTLSGSSRIRAVSSSPRRATGMT